MCMYMYKTLLSKRTKVSWPCMAQAPTHEPPFWDFHCPGPPVAPGATAWAVMAAFVAPGATAWAVMVGTTWCHGVAPGF